MHLKDCSPDTTRMMYINLLKRGDDRKCFLCQWDNSQEIQRVIIMLLPMASTRNVDELPRLIVVSHFLFKVWRRTTRTERWSFFSNTAALPFSPSKGYSVASCLQVLTCQYSHAALTT